jgi:hypothetical protein
MQTCNWDSGHLGIPDLARVHTQINSGTRFPPTFPHLRIPGISSMCGRGFWHAATGPFASIFTDPGSFSSIFRKPVRPPKGIGSSGRAILRNIYACPDLRFQTLCAPR